MQNSVVSSRSSLAGASCNRPVLCQFLARASCDKRDPVSRESRMWLTQSAQDRRQPTASAAAICF